MEARHPLDIYLDEIDESLTEFAKQAGIGRATVFRVVSGYYRSARTDMLAKIEKATKGHVTILDMVKWQQAHWRKVDGAKRGNGEGARASG